MPVPLDLDGLDWNDIRLFLAAARCRSFSGAALALGTTQATVSRRIAQFEHRIGRALFQRNTAGVELTDAGAALLDAAQGMEQAAAGFAQAVEALGDTMAGTVMISAGDGVISYLLTEAVAPLRGRWPELAVRFKGFARAQQIASADADLFLIPLAPQEPLLWQGAAFRTRRVARLGFMPFASRGFLAERPAPRSVAEIAACALVDHATYREDAGLQPWNELVARLQEERPAAVMVVDSTAALHRAIKAGLGIGLLPSYAPAIDPDLVPIDCGLAGLPMDLWLGGHDATLKLRRVRVVFDAIVQYFAANPDWFGHRPG
ncbi:MAG TPA: LysR family transcriptional regulator [Alphaproteobacteria bacterium]|nr:LysR family transcriptional regulator [Alphaproteobacteria bacterium]